MTTPIPVPGETERLIPNSGSTLDASPTVIVELLTPLPVGASVVLLRDGLALMLVPLQVTPLAFQFNDSALTTGAHTYTVEVRQAARVENGNEYTILIDSPIETPVDTFTLDQTFEARYFSALSKECVFTINRITSNANSEATCRLVVTMQNLKGIVQTTILNQVVQFNALELMVKVLVPFPERIKTSSDMLPPAHRVVASLEV